MAGPRYNAKDLHLLGAEGTFPRQAKKKRAKKKKKAEVAEEHIQDFVDGYLDLKHIPYIRIPDEAYEAIFANQHVPVWKKKIIADFIKGLPDTIVLQPVGEYCLALPLELKSSIGKLSPQQKDWRVSINTTVERSFDGARKAIDRFLAYCESQK